MQTPTQARIQTWSEKHTRELVRLVDDCDSPVATACIIIGAMTGVLEHHDGIDMAAKILSGFSNNIKVHIVQTAPARDDEGAGYA